MRFFRLLPLLLAATSTIALAQLPEQVIPASSPPRIFCYTNKEAAFFAGVLNGPNSSGFHGITQEKQKIFEQYWLRLGEQLLDPSTAEVTVTPAGFRRSYPLHNTVEDVVFADSISLLCVTVRSEYRGSVRIYPAFSAWWQDAMQSRHGDLYRMSKEGIQGAAAVTGLAGDWEILRPRDLEQFPNPAPMHMPLYYYGQCTGTFGFSVGYYFAGYPPINRDVQGLLRARLSKERRLVNLLDASGFSCTDRETESAFAWIRTSMDALVMRQQGAGIYAGLPWFDDYWGRDTFISFPGALLVTGQFETAEQVLRSYLRYMDRDSTSVTYGRIPNRIQPRDVIYNTVDGTPWMVVQAWEYYSYSGNENFLREIMPDIERTISGAMRHTDAHFLLTHGGAETWMDAVGPDGAWSPRGSRAIDIQALWYAQLRAAARIASVAGDRQRAEGWNRYADRVQESMLRLFVDPGEKRFNDHLNDDDTPDTQLRPNILFPFTIPGSDVFAALDDSIVDPALGQLFAEAVYPHGVASLSQYDARFHPWHEAPRFYPKDAAYHNGTIWTWLTGPAVTVLTRRGLADSAWVLTRTLQRLAIDAGAVGSIPECTDALPRDGADFPRWSGAFSQAWSNAEYLRNWYQDYLGISPSWSATEPVLTLAPALPTALLNQPGDSVTAKVRIGSSWVRVTYTQEAEGRSVRLRHLSGKQAVRIDPGNGETLLLKPDTEARTALATAPAVISRPDSLPIFALPRDTDSIAVILPPAWPRIEGSLATRRNESATDLCSAFDAEGDDRGADGGQRYPTNALFPKGIADLRAFDVSADAEMLYFTVRMGMLTQPGWHPEYGFQLTVLAIAIDQTHDPDQQSRNIGLNSGYVLPEGEGYDRLIVVGGGVRVLDANADILCEFIPESPTDAFGSVHSGEIRFALPRSCLGGAYDHWRYTIVAGLQDDHGGAGIGEFRSVHPQPSEWHGGGSTPGVNWYDVMECPVE